MTEKDIHSTRKEAALAGVRRSNPLHVLLSRQSIQSMGRTSYVTSLALVEIELEIGGL